MKDVLMVFFGSIAATIITAIVFIFILIFVTAPFWFIPLIIWALRT